MLMFSVQYVSKMVQTADGGGRADRPFHTFCTPSLCFVAVCSILIGKAKVLVEI